MSTVLCFAYGSNMLAARLRYRVPGCRFHVTAQLPKHRLCFNKRSKDHSGKCNAYFTGQRTDFVFGVVYEIPQTEKAALDRAEGLGLGYREQHVIVVLSQEMSLTVCTYVADPHAVDDNLKPYSWYKEFVLAGAKEHKLPEEYINRHIRTVAATVDPDQKREQSRRAELVERAKGQSPEL